MRPAVECSRPCGRRGRNVHREALLVAVSTDVIAPLQLTRGVVDRLKVPAQETDEHLRPLRPQGVENTSTAGSSYFQRSSGPTEAEGVASFLEGF